MSESGAAVRGRPELATRGRPRRGALRRAVHDLAGAAPVVAAGSRHREREWLERARAARLTIGLALVPFAGIAFLWFMGVVRDRFKETEDQLFSSVFIGSGLLFLAMVFVSAALAGGIVTTIPMIADDGAATRWRPSGGR